MKEKSMKTQMAVESTSLLLKGKLKIKQFWIG